VVEEMPVGVTACVITFNEEQNIKACLESVAWTDEIIVVDSFSTDKTVEICERYTKKVFQRAWPGFLDQKSFAVAQATNHWILSLDADERTSQSLRDEILEALKRNTEVNGYYMPRRTYYLGRWINHGGWYPNYQLRLFRKDKGKWTGENLHEKVTVIGKTKVLRNDLLHYAYRDLSDQLQTIDHFSQVSAEIMRGKGVRVTPFHLVFRPPIKFLETYIYKQGFRDGVPGLVNAIAYSFYMFMKYAKTWEGQRNRKNKNEIDEQTPLS
jgi:glycosyltransferase involved in cell wall biosynthesis